ncbi:hypothetical protein OG756_36855 [Streptomyces sp. NBC_01310]|nr:hypothetical protein OG756_36855 [Streptomyces sp. NBC_01310]
MAREDLSNPRFTEFSARTRMSGINLSWDNGAGCAIRKGAVTQVCDWVVARGGTPLALRGVRYRPASAQDLLRRNLGVHGLGGLILPLVGIQLIDLVGSTVPGLG